MYGKKQSCRLIVRLATEDVARFRFLLEAYDNLAIFSVLERRPALIKVIVAPESMGYLETVFEHMRQTMGFCFQPWPFDKA